MGQVSFCIKVEVSIIFLCLHFFFPSTCTCYRTCFEGNDCKTYVTVVDEQTIFNRERHTHDVSQYSVRRIFSPKDKETGDYRLCTHCRYNNYYHDV